MVASECEPFAKTGGLADVVDALARALGELGHDVDVYLPLYRDVVPPPDPDPRTLSVPVATGTPRSSAMGTDPLEPTTVRLLSAPADGYRIRLVDHPPSFDRPSYYGGPDGDYPDNPARFTLLGGTMIEAIRSEGGVDAIHGHDWQSGPSLLLLAHAYRDDPLVARTATVLTIHNLAYHGWTPRGSAWQLGLGEAARSVGKPEGIDLLREAILAADVVNTVSPTYAEESRGPEYGAGLDDVLRAKGDRYLGILNGIDARLWDPATDAALPARFSLQDLAGKVTCKRELMARLGLDLGTGEPGWRKSEQDADDGWGERGAPLSGIVGRLDPQKGFDLLASAAPALLRAGSRLVVLGTGDERLVTALKELAAERPDRLAVIARFDRDEARRIYAASDLFLMPSRFEPCGQGQMIALRYGSIPIVRRTGGLADTIVDADADPDRGNGFVFGPPDPGALLEAAGRAIAAYRDEQRWTRLVQRGMRQDFSWAGRARDYVALYERARSMLTRTLLGNARTPTSDASP